MKPHAGSRLELSAIGVEIGEKKEPTSNSVRKFWSDYCGITDNGYRYTYGAQSGRMVNFFRNRLFKNTNEIRGGESEQDPTASTREAIYVEYDKYAPQRDRDNAIAQELPDGKDTKFRAKKIKYGNHNAMWEVLSGHLYRLTGLSAPDSRMMVCEEYAQDKIPDVYVASPLITGYHDLGNFLIDETVITSFIDSEEKLKIWREEKAKIDKINKKPAQGEVVSDTDKLARIKAWSNIYNLLPHYVHNEIEKSFAAGKFIGNWDFANFNLNNIGVKFTFDRNRKVASFESVFVDFGNSGRSGFKGLGKKQSLTHANTEAKKMSPESTDYDPALAFTEEELAFIADYRTDSQTAELKEISRIKQSLEKGEIAQDEATNKLNKIEAKYFNKAVNLIAKELADNETSENPNLPSDAVSFGRSIIFKAAHHISPAEASLAMENTIGLLTISDLPRNLPFGILFEKAIKEKTQAALKIIKEATTILADVDDSNIDLDTPLQSPKLSNNPSIYRDSEIEMAFRLSLITDQAIEKVVKNWYLYEEFPDVFAPKNKSEDDEEFKSCTQVAEIFKHRRDHLVASIPQEIIDEWVARNKPWAIAAQESVNLMILKESRDPDPDFEEKYPFEPTSGDASPQKMSSLSLSRKSSNKSLFTYPNSEENCSETSDYDSAISTPKRNGLPEIKTRTIEEKNSFETRIGRTPSYQIGMPAAAEILHQTEFYLSQQSTAQSKIKILEKNRNPQDKEFDEIIREQIDSLKTEQELEKIKKALKFISTHIQSWKESFGLDSRPDCKFFDLTCSRETYKTQNRDHLAIDADQDLSQKENLVRSKKILAEDSFVYQGFVDNLQKLSNSTRSLSAKIVSASATSVSQQTSREISK